MSLEPARQTDITALADSCFSYIVSEPEELMNFMKYAGYSPDTIQKAVGTEALNLALLDYFASNESALMAMCAAGNLTPERFMNVWQRLNASY